MIYPVLSSYPGVHASTIAIDVETTVRSNLYQGIELSILQGM